MIFSIYNKTDVFRSFGKNMPLIGSTGVLLDVMRAPREYLLGTNLVLPYIFTPMYMYDKKYYPQFLSGSGKCLMTIFCIHRLSVNKCMRTYKIT